MTWASNADDNGSVMVEFGPTFVTDVLVTYNEAAYPLANNNNPGFRGIGLFGNTVLPVELIEFTIE